MHRGWWGDSRYQSHKMTVKEGRCSEEQTMSVVFYLVVIFMNLETGNKVTHENRWTALYLPTFYALLEGRSLTE